MKAPAKLRWLYALSILFICLFGVQLAILATRSIKYGGLQCMIAAGVAIGAFAGYTVIRTAWRAVAQAYSTRKWQKRFRANLHAKLTKRMAYRYRELGTKILVVRDDAFVALAIGMRKPVIVLSDTVIDRFDEEEVRAIVLHEWHHCSNRDNAKLFFARMLTEAFGYFPMMRPIFRYYQTWAELLADRFAIRRMGTEVPLAGVLLKLSKLGGERRRAAAVHFAATTLDYRIAQVLEPEKTVKVKVAVLRPLLASVSLLLLFMLGGDA